MRMRRSLVAFLALVVAAGCSMLDSRDRALRDLRGVQLSPAQPKPAFTLTDTRGQPYDFLKETSGKVALLYYGYTNCPDVCPAQLGNIAGAFKRLSPEDQARVRVVFVTTDPARDTAAHLRAWLNNFDTSFVGLRGNIADINQTLAHLGMPPAEIEPMPAMPGPKAMTYGVGHAAQVLAFTPDDSLHVEYPSGFTTADYAADLPRLLKITKR
jgi:protein SCO1